MAEATNQQMQAFSDQRLRVRAELVRAIVNALRDDQASISDVFARASGANPWNDARVDGPPKLLASQDVLTFDAFSKLFLKCIDGTATLADVANLHSNYLIFLSACVRSL